MEKIKVDLNKYKNKNTKACRYSWQETAKKCIEDFGVLPRYAPIVFKHAKNNITFLNGVIADLTESATYKGADLKTYGKLLIWKLQKEPKLKKTKKQVTCCKYSKT